MGVDGRPNSPAQGSGAVRRPGADSIGPVTDRTYTLLRHGQSTYNVRGLLNGDPSVTVRLTDVGRGQCVVARDRLADAPVELAVHTRFGRTIETLGIVMEGRDVPVTVYPELDDVVLGVFEGAPIRDYRAWRRDHTPADRPSGGGESRLDVLARYAAGFERLLTETARHAVVVAHDLPIRFLQNAVNRDDPLEGPITGVPNAVPFTFSDAEVRRGVAAMRARIAEE